MNRRTVVEPATSPPPSRRRIYVEASAGVRALRGSYMPAGLTPAAVS